MDEPKMHGKPDLATDQSGGNCESVWPVFLQRTEKMVKEVMRCEMCAVYLVDRESNEMVFTRVLPGPDGSPKTQEIRLPYGTGLAGWCAQNDKTLLVPDASNDPRFFKGAETRYSTRSMVCVPMHRGNSLCGVLQVMNRIGEAPFDQRDVEMLVAISDQLSITIETVFQKESSVQEESNIPRVLEVFIDAWNPTVSAKSRRVADYSLRMAIEMAIDSQALESLRLASLFHDIGLIGIPFPIVMKNTDLTPEEFGLFKRHPEIGAMLVKEVKSFSGAVPGVLHHHESFDGTGFPDGLRGKDIPLSARIIRVADHFDTLTKGWHFGTTLLSPDEAIVSLRDFSGKEFDPDCVEAIAQAHFRRPFGDASISSL